jgi:hypothetical protein
MTVTTCAHGIRSPWQCHDCDRENPPPRCEHGRIVGYCDGCEPNPAMTAQHLSGSRGRTMTETETVAEKLLYPVHFSVYDQATVDDVECMIDIADEHGVAIIDKAELEKLYDRIEAITRTDEARPDGFVGMHFDECDYFKSRGSKSCNMDCCS